MEEIKKELLQEILSTIERNCKDKEVGISFSGGVDSSLLAKACEKLGKKVNLLTIGLPNSFDLINSKKSSQALGLTHFTKVLKLEEVEEGIKKVMEITQPQSLVDLEIRLGYYFIFILAKEKKIKTVLSANGMDELFCGYKRCCKFLRVSEDSLKSFIQETIEKAFENHEGMEKIAKNFEINFIEPFLDSNFIEFAQKIPLELKIKNPEDNLRKHIVREIALELSVPKEIAFKTKKSFQYSSGIHNAIEKLGKKYFTKKEAKNLGFRGIREAYINLLKSR
jgi:asparagine synthase (glutamine-hydrolysing)